MLYMYGDESQNPSDPFWGIGVIFTKNPSLHLSRIREIRRACGYLSTEMKYSSSDYSQVLPAIRLIDYFFSTSDLYFKIIVKDQKFFDVNTFNNNIYGLDKWKMAYVTTYRNLCKSIKPSDYGETEMSLNYDKKGFMTGTMMQQFLKSKVPCLSYAVPKDSKETLRNGEFTDTALMIQFCDLICGTLMSLFYEETTDTSRRFKKIYRKALLTNCPNLKTKLVGKTHYYHQNNNKLNVFYMNK